MKDGSGSNVFFRARHGPPYLIHLFDMIFPRALGVGHDDDAFGQPVVRLFLGTLLACDAQLSLQFLDQPVLRITLVEDEGAHFPPNDAVPEHGMDVGRLLGASDDGLDLRHGQRPWSDPNRLVGLNKKGHASGGLG